MSSVIDVVIPEVGESVSEASIGRWFFKDGDLVEKDQPLFELDSDKASMEVTAEKSGRLQIMANEGDVVQIGSVVAKIDTAAAGKAAAPKKQEPSEVSQEDEQQEEQKIAASGGGRSTSAARLDDSKIKKFPPSQRKAIRQGKLELINQSAPSAATAAASTETRQPMSSLRRTIANRLLYSQQSNATLTTFNEVDMSHVLKVRSALKDKFQQQTGIKLGFMSFFSAAVVHALKEFPIVNSHIEENDIVTPDGMHIGIAVSTDKGLVVPVLRYAENMTYADIESGIAGLAEKARDGKLSISDMQGGSFTITNGGVFGSLLSTPIINPPQSGILGMHKTEYRPVAIQKEDGSFSVEVRPMMYLALSYDHRLIDGATSVSFLVKVKEYLESVKESQVL